MGFEPTPNIEIQITWPCCSVKLHFAGYKSLSFFYLSADNILLNKTSDGVSIKVADFGLARRCQGQVPGGTKPVGTQTQWSPEKAEARVGYGFGAEIWAAVCVLVHMLSGLPPWMKRYENFKALIVVVSVCL